MTQRSRYFYCYVYKMISVSTIRTFVKAAKIHCYYDTFIAL